MIEAIECWHFAAEDRKLHYGDDRLIEVGIMHEVTVTPKCCEAGLHGSIRAIDALEYAPGSTICRVRISGEIHQQNDKLCGQRREYLAIADATGELRSFSRWCALQVIHIWDAPEIVRQYLETGEESIRAAARDAAWAAARDAACAAATAATSAAAWAAASAAAWAAARAAGWAAARAAARDATSVAASDAAWAATSAAAWVATSDATSVAAKDAASAAAWAAARDAASDVQNAELDRRLRKLLNLAEAA